MRCSFIQAQFELDQENWAWMKEHRIDSATGQILPDPNAPAKCSPAELQASISRLDIIDTLGSSSDAGSGTDVRTSSSRWAWMKEHRIDSATGQILPDPNAPAKCSPETSALLHLPP
jgi:hypothetical protein